MESQNNICTLKAKNCSTKKITILCISANLKLRVYRDAFLNFKKLIFCCVIKHVVLNLSVYSWWVREKGQKEIQKENVGKSVLSLIMWIYVYVYIYIFLRRDGKMWVKTQQWNRRNVWAIERSLIGQYPEMKVGKRQNEVFKLRFTRNTVIY